MMDFKEFLNVRKEANIFNAAAVKMFEDTVIKKYPSEVKGKFLTIGQVRAASKRKDCVFCDHNKIEASNIEKHNFKGFDFLSFTPLDPITPGHLLVIPNIHVDDASVEAHITGLTFELATLIADKTNYKHYNLIVNKGADADQTVFHLHVHIVPRYKDDDTITIWNKDHVKT